MHTITVEVSREDIRYAEAYPLYFNPVTLALRRVTGLEWGQADNKVWRKGYSYLYTLPKEAVDLINRFQYIEPIEPITFELS